MRVGGAGPPPFITFTITSKVAVYAPAEWADTLTLFHLYQYCTLWSQPSVWCHVLCACMECPCTHHPEGILRSGQSPCPHVWPFLCPHTSYLWLYQPKIEGISTYSMSVFCKFLCTVKKVSDFPVPAAGMSLTNSPLLFQAMEFGW